MPSRKPGHFATLLRVRKRVEELKSQALGATRRRLHDAVKDRASIGDEQRDTLARAGALLEEEFDASDVRRYYQYERHLARLAVQKDAEIRALERTAAAQRKELEEALKRRRVAEKLEERTAAVYQDYVRKEEQKALDELASSHAAAKRGPGRAARGK
ncbi:MAG: flagellar FliJ family protein [Candidatus Hydrogenedentes bacterium]|nr:flagellar FliJ family protein [Candidatus Hydrogenedentota bacterium]